MSRLPPLHRLQRISSAVVDQGISSLGNAVVMFAFARGASVDGFAAVALLLGSGFGAMSITRALSIPVLGLNTHREEHEARRSHSRHMLTSSGLIGMCGAVVGLLALRLSGLDSALDWYVVLGLSVGVVVACCEEVVRVSALTWQASQVAIRIDAVWLAFSGCGLWASELNQGGSEIWVTSAWTLGAVAALTIGLHSLKIIPSTRGTWRWVTQQVSILAPTLAAAAGSTIAATAGGILVARVYSADDLAAWRGASLVMSPMTVISAVAPILIIRAITQQRVGRPNRTDDRRVVFFAVVLLVASVLLGVLLSAIPSAWLEVFLGSTASLAQTVLIPVSMIVGTDAVLAAAIATTNAVRRHRLASVSVLVNSVAGIALIAASGWLAVPFASLLLLSCVPTAVLGLGLFFRGRRLVSA